MPEFLRESLPLFWPETTLALAFIVAMIFEFLAKRKGHITGVLVLVGLVLTLVQLPFQPVEPKAIFAGMYTVDPFSTFFKYIILCTAIVVVIFSYQSDELRKEMNHLGEYFCFIGAVTLGMILMSGASNLLMMYLSIELVSITSYILAGFSKSMKRSGEAALKYVIYGGVSSGIMLYGISMIYGLTGSMDVRVIHAMIMQGTVMLSGWTLAAFIAAIVMMLAGFGYKISAVPFHFWTPDVYEGAPITVTAFLAVASKAAGFAVMLRFFFVALIQAPVAQGVWMSFTGLDWPAILAAVSVLTMTLGNVVAVWQDNLKRMLAYSSIAHAGYMLMGAVVMSSAGISAMMFYFVMYFFMNLGAFYVVMAVADRIGSENIDDYKGLGRRAPVLAASLSIFLISLTGLPPTSGFVAKLFLFAAVLDTSYTWLVVVAALNTVISLYYYARVFRNMYLRDADDGQHTPVRFAPAITVVTILFVIPNILFCFYFQPILSFAQQSAVMLMR